ncbi:MAG: hypothetical protein HS108_13510 [Planctomycetes bacterium]|jgi:hypothetical protein|nr:hypothetical protein [Planctomycetota bacterium]MCL4730168.1 hypothetical protein [Planctomycetota bacterium]
MKTLLTAIAAALLGGGAAVGAVASGLVPVPAPETTARRAPAAPAAEPAAQPGADHTAELNDLKSRIRELELAATRATPATPNKELAALRAELDELKRRPAPAAKPAETVVAPREGPAPTEPAFEESVRAVYAKMEAERVEQRRLDRQAARVAQLEESKKRIAETTPRFVESQAQRLNLDATQVAAVSNALVAHLQARAELDSERQGMRIDDQEIDNAAFEEREKALNDAALAALTATLPKETAEQLLRTANRMSGGPGRFGQGGPGQGNGQGGFVPPGRRGGGGNN